MRIPPLLLAAALLTAPALTAIEIPKGDLEQHTARKREFVVFNPRYKELRATREEQAHELGRQVSERETKGQDTACSHQILNEVTWLLGNTARFERIDQRLHDLKATLAHPQDEAKAMLQDPADGSWGRCYTEWFFKLDASFDHLEKGTGDGKAPPRLLDRVNSADKLRSYFTALAISDISRSGVDHRREFNESLSNLMRLILRDRPAGYHWDPAVKTTLMELIQHRFRNPITGWWGESYIRDKHLVFVDDLSITFHVVRYLGGKVSDLSKVVDTLLAVKDQQYAVGWLENGHYANHHNMDVVVLFGYAWSAATEAQKRIASAEIQKMLHWCLTESLQPDGSFKESTTDDSVEERTYFGAAFLARIGYFDKSKRFWTKQNFPDSDAVRQKIVGYMKKHQSSGGAGGSFYANALQELDRK